ncbi:protein NDR1-like [Cynara cardunculus var. scolymus]|uniref:protein NDR1-like n=1 Tax=Cynara cardunculus var. scolymus TaxID=59895 RepID=UPI000D62C91F|nr:protein NDR1-like [Cynara cardunculus var. scolymus]
MGLKTLICLVTTAILVVLTFFAIYITRVLPSIQLQEFYVPALNTTTGNLTATNNTIYINLRLKNRNPATGLHYDPLYLNISFIPNEDRNNTSMIALGEYRMRGFYQGNGKAKSVMGALMTRGLPVASSGFFRVEFFGKVRYKLVGYRKRHKMKLAADVDVDEKTGNKVENEVIRLVKSGANWYKKRPSITVVPVSMILLAMLFI